MKTVVLRAPILTSSGYGVHSRQVARWLMAKHDAKKIKLTIQALPWGNTPWIINANAHDGFIGKVMALTTSVHGVHDYSFQVQLPNEWDPSIARSNIGITAAVETDIANPAWSNACNSMSKVIVPSKHIASVLATSASFKGDKCAVVPESYPDVFREQPTEISLPGLETDFNFLMVGQLTGNRPENDRKNLFYAVKWFCETFAGDQSVGLIVKSNSGRNTKIDRNVTLNTLRQVLWEVRPGQFPKIYLVHGDLTDAEMHALYRHPTVKCFLAPTRGEGFGLPILEAAVAGVPVIATNWSGHLDFMGRGKFIKLDYELKTIPDNRVDNAIFMKGARWAEVNEGDFKAKVKKIRDSWSIPRDWARELSEKLVQEYSFEAIAAKYDAEFPELM
jgi:glycosyltransferase involved in cell wall biosynthesis